MENSEKLLELIEELIHEKKDIFLSDLQRTVLLNTLENTRKTYDDIAEECGYSAKYIKQDVAPKLWQLISEIFNQKVSKSNVKAILKQQINSQPNIVEECLTVTSSLNQYTATESRESVNILLVDDQPQNLKLLTDLLEQQGYELRQAINGKMALQAVSLSPPDLILLDIKMPELDGYTVCQKLKANCKTQDIPVIFVSSFDEAWDKVKAFNVGGSDYITKPFKVVEVLARIENQLKIASLQKEVKELREKNRELQEELEKL